MNCLKFLGLFLIFSSLIQLSVFSQTITVACSPWKPYYYSEDGVIKGSVYEIAKLVLKRAEIDANFTIEPWKRVYLRGLNEPNYLISCISRTKKREKLFHWVGVVRKTTNYNFYKLKKSDISLKSHKDTLNYRVGVMRGSLTEDFMNSLSHKNLLTVTKAHQLVKLLKIGRAELVLEATNVIPAESKIAKIDPEIFEIALHGYGVTTNLSLGKKTSPQVVQKVHEAYEALEAEGKIILP